MAKEKHELADPRAASFPEDSALWGLLLAWAYAEEMLDYQNGAFSLYGGLHGCRCGGARLVRVGKLVRLERGLWDEEEWQKLRARFLVPHTELLRMLLLRLGAWAAERADLAGESEPMKQEVLL